MAYHIDNHIVCKHEMLVKLVFMPALYMEISFESHGNTDVDTVSRGLV